MTIENHAESLGTAALRRRITELEQQLAECQQTRELCQALIEHSLQGVIILQDEHVVFANPQLSALTGYTVPELLQMSFLDLAATTHPEDHGMVLSRWQSRVGENPPTRRLRYRIIRKDGEIRWLESFAYAIEYRGRPALHGVVIDVTEQVTAEQARRESEEQYRRMVDSAEEGIWVMDENFLTTFANAHLAAMLGYTVEEMIGQHVEAFMFEDQLPDHRARMQQRTRGEIGRYERRFRRKDGTAVWVIVSATPMMDAGGHFKGSFAMVTDITERKCIEEALQESEARFRGVIEQSLDGIVLLDSRGTVNEWNRGLEQITGLSATSVLGKPLWDVQFSLAVEEERRIPGTYDRVRQLVQKTLTQGALPWMNRVLEHEIQRPDGERRFVQTRLFSIMAGGERMLCSVMQDISDHKYAEQRLQQSEQRFRQLFEYAPLGYQSLDKQGNVLEVNQAWLDTLGYSREEVMDHWFGDFLMPDSRARFLIAFPRFQETGEAHDVQFDMICKDGSVITASFEGKISYDDQGQFQKTHCILSNVTERNRMERALRESEERYRSLFRDAPISLWEEDFSEVKATLERLRASGVEDLRDYFKTHPDVLRECVHQIKVLETNQATLDLFEASAQERAGKVFETLPESPISDQRIWDCFIDEFCTFAEGRTRFEGEMPLHVQSGTPHWVFLRVSIAPGYEESWAKVFSSVVDLTAQKRAEEQFRFRATLLSQLSDAVLCTDLDFIIQDWNLAAERIYGWRAEEVIGRRMGEVIPFDYSGTSRETILAHFLKHGEWRGETVQTRKDGTSLNIFSSVSYLRDEAGSPVGILAVCRDITASKRIEQAEHEQRALAEALRDTASLLTGTLNLDEVLDRILSHVERVLPHDSAIVILINNGSARVVRGQGYAARDLEMIPLTLEIPLTTLPNFRQMYDTHQPLIVPDTYHSPHWMVLEERSWIRSFAGAPIRVDGQVIGFLSLYSQTPNFFKPECAGPLMVFADQAAAALKNAQLYNEIQAYAAELEARVEERTAQFKQAKEHVETILNSSSDVIILLSTDGLIRQVNPSFNEIFNCPPDHSTDKPLSMLVAPDSVDPLMAALHAAVEQKRLQRIAIEVCYNADIMFDADVALSPIVQADGQVAGVVCNLHDITMLKQTEASLRRMLTREMELGELKSRFIATTSHEFRTPLAIIQSSADLLARYADRLSLEQKQKEFQHIRSSVAAMVALLDDILVISRAESGTLEFAPEPLNLETFSRDLLSVFELTSGRDHHLVFSYTGGPGEVMLDPKLLRHIVNNLLSNAIKYSHPHTTVTFEVAHDNRRVTLRVKDEGIGIPQADQARLFEPFHRAQNVETIPGTGLGLAIVKQSVEMLRGTIVVESGEGTGTIFTVTLPAMTSANSSR